MANEDLTLYFCPLTCARVTMVALEQTRAAYDVQPVNLMAGAQHAAEFRAINPMGKVPALRIGERVLTENAAILLWLAARYPAAGLLPPAADPVAAAMAHADVIWCAASLHPITRQIVAPFHYTEGDPAAVRAKGIATARGLLDRLEARFAAADWWFGAAASIVDTYLAWVVSGWALGIDLAAWPAVQAHSARTAARPAFVAMLAREAALIAAAGIEVPAALRPR